MNPLLSTFVRLTLIIAAALVGLLVLVLLLKVVIVAAIVAGVVVGGLFLYKLIRRSRKDVAVSRR